MYRFSQIASLIGLLFFCYAQARGLTVERMFQGGRSSNAYASNNYHK